MIHALLNRTETLMLLSSPEANNSLALIDPLRNFQPNLSGVTLSINGVVASPSVSDTTSLLLNVWSDSPMKLNVPDTLILSRPGLLLSCSLPFNDVIIIVGDALNGMKLSVNG